MKRMSLTKRLTLGLGIMTLGLCAALPFRRTTAPEEQLVADATSNQLSLGDGVSLQMPGQTLAAPLGSEPPAPWTAENDQDSASALAARVAEAEETLQTKPPALPDQYRPLFKPQPGSDGSGHVVSPGGPQTPRKPVKKHTIHDGDTLESLAVRYLGDAQRAPEILAANRDLLSDPQLLPIGVAITIPVARESGERADALATDDATPLVPLPAEGFRRGR